jgi:hypothetical protein
LSSPTEDLKTVRYSYSLETVQDFLIKLGIKPLLYLLEISTFSLNNDIVRLTKIMNKLLICQRSQNFEFQSHFSVSKIGRIFPKNIFCEASKYHTRNKMPIGYCTHLKQQLLIIWRISLFRTQTYR